MLFLTKGQTVPETVQAVEDAAAVARKGGNLSQLVNLMLSRARNAMIEGDLIAAAQLADQALELAICGTNPGDVALVHFFQISVCHLRGDLAGAETHFTVGFELVPASPATAWFVGLASWNAWTLGWIDLARERSHASIVAAANADIFTKEVVPFNAARLLIWLGEYEQAERSLAECLAKMEKFQVPEGIADAKCNLGYARAQLGHTVDGIALIREGLSRLQVVGLHWSTPTDYAFLAAAQERAGLLDEALESIEQALLANPDELVYQPEILRMRGELRLKLGHSEEAEADFHEAIVLAAGMSAKSWELRAATSLTRLLRDTAAATKRVRRLPKSTTGSPKASTPPISKTPKRCSKNYSELPMNVWDSHNAELCKTIGGRIAPRRSFALLRMTDGKTL
jgi:tetratricopeptide (TPR) repeat protein